MKRRIKMIGFDLDGTLLTTDKRLTEHTRQVLERHYSACGYRQAPQRSSP